VLDSWKRNVYTAYSVNNPTLYIKTDLAANNNYSEETYKIRTPTTWAKRNRKNADNSKYLRKDTVSNK
jgi:hypothetical protein